MLHSIKNLGNIQIYKSAFESFLFILSYFLIKMNKFSKQSKKIWNFDLHENLNSTFLNSKKSL